MEYEERREVWCGCYLLYIENYESHKHFQDMYMCGHDFTDPSQDMRTTVYLLWPWIKNVFPCSLTLLKFWPQNKNVYLYLNLFPRFYNHGISTNWPWCTNTRKQNSKTWLQFMKTRKQVSTTCQQFTKIKSQISST